MHEIRQEKEHEREIRIVVQSRVNKYILLFKLSSSD